MYMHIAVCTNVLSKIDFIQTTDLLVTLVNKTRFLPSTQMFNQFFFITQTTITLLGFFFFHLC